MSPEETLSQPEVVGDVGSLGAPTASGIECPACGTQNTADSKFCRHCGQLLRSLASGAPTEAKKAAVVAETDDDEEEMSSPAKIDERRAHGLLDRALAHSERGDLNAAILACRQAIALDHNHAEPYALLGTLLERNGDLRGAMGAYERVLEISPDNELERDSLNRLKARVDRAPNFNFNPEELFPSNETLPSVAAPVVENSPMSAEMPAGIEARLPPTSSSLQPVETPVSVETPADDLVFDFDPAPANTTPSVSPLAAAMDGETVSRVGMPVPPSPVPVSTSGSVPKIERRHEQRRQVDLPVATNRRVVSDRRVSAPKAATFAPPAWPTSSPSLPRTNPLSTTPVIAPLDFSFGATPTPSTPLWARFMRDSSFFVRALPLVVVGVLGLGFLGWARSQAVAGDTNAISTVTNDTVVQPDPGTQVVQPNQVTGVSVIPTPASGGGLSITNATSAPIPPAANTQPISGTNTQTQVSAPATNTSPSVPSSGNSGAGRQNGGTPSFPRPLPPAAVPPPSTTNTNSGNSGSNIILPPPQTGNGEAPPPRIRVGGGVPLNPGGSPQEGRIRITQGNIGNGRSVAPPPRTGSVARGEERNASAAGNNGNQDRVIDSLTRALNSSGGDQGYLLQQRAMAFMDRQDYGRAAEDFQAAINAYQNQINNGENVTAAQAGLRAARSGLNLAQAQR